LWKRGGVQTQHIQRKRRRTTGISGISYRFGESKKDLALESGKEEGARPGSAFLLFQKKNRSLSSSGSKARRERPAP